MTNCCLLMVYDTQACQYIANHSEAEVVVVENVAQLAKFTKVSGPHPIGSSRLSPEYGRT